MCENRMLTFKIIREDLTESNYSKNLLEKIFLYKISIILVLLGL